jgi:hypothetical protein
VLGIDKLLIHGNTIELIAASPTLTPIGMCVHDEGAGDDPPAMG